MQRTCGIFLILASLLLLVPVAGNAHPAVVVVDWIWDHIGGKDNYKSARYVKFTWAVENEGEIVGQRHHTWDRYSGDYVLELEDPKTGDDLKIYFNIDTKKGRALRNNTPLEGDEATELIDKAFRVFTNDTYWLLLPMKLNDYGVRLTFDRHDGVGEEKDQAIVLHMAFEDVGLTPGDQYWVFVRHDGQIIKWSYRLEGGQEGEHMWTDEKDCGMGIMLSTRKASLDGKRAIVFPNVQFSREMDPAVFKMADGR